MMTAAAGACLTAAARYSANAIRLRPGIALLSTTSRPRLYHRHSFTGDGARWQFGDHFRPRRRCRSVWQLSTVMTIMKEVGFSMPPIRAPTGFSQVATVPAQPSRQPALRQYRPVVDNRRSNLACITTTPDVRGTYGGDVVVAALLC